MINYESNASTPQEKLAKQSKVLITAQIFLLFSVFGIKTLYYPSSVRRSVVNTVCVNGTVGEDRGGHMTMERWSHCMQSGRILFPMCK